MRSTYIYADVSANPIYDEKELFRRVAAGDVPAFRIIFDQYKEKLYTYIARLSKSHEVAEEVVQDVFLKLWSNRESLTDIERPATFIFVAARNRMIDHLRRIAHQQDLRERIWRTMKEGCSFIEELMDWKESNLLVGEALAGLSEQKRTIFHLSRYEGLTHREIAQQLQLSESTVKNHLVDALRHIRSYLRRHEGEGLALAFLLLLRP